MNFPNFNDYIKDIASQSPEGQQIVKELDEELCKNKKLIESQAKLRDKVENLELDGFMLNDIASQQKEQISQRETEEKTALQCYDTLMELKNIIHHLDLGKIIMCDVLKKHIELVSDLRFKEELFKKKFEQSLIMDKRPEVCQFRVQIAERLQLEKELEYVQKDIVQCKYMWDKKCSKSIAKRNQVIVELIKERKELREKHQQIQFGKRQENTANRVDKSFTKSFENFFNINNLFNIYAIPRPISVVLPSSSTEISTLEPKRSILCESGVKSSENATKKQVHFKPDLESVVFIEKTTETEAQTSYKKNDIDMERNLIIRSEEQIETMELQSNPICEQNISVNDNTVDIDFEAQSSPSSTDSAINAETALVQDEKPKILENIIIKAANVPANDVQLAVNASRSLNAKSIFKVPKDVRRNLSPAESSVESSNASNQESNTPNDSLASYTELINKPEENEHELNMDSYDGNRDRDFNSTDWNFQVPHATDDFFFDTPIMDQKPNESFF